MAVKARDSITLTKVVDGSDGRSIVLFQREFYLSTSKTTCTGGAWSTTQPQWTSGKYLWTRNKITYKNPSSVEYTTPEVDTTWEAIKDIQVGGRNLLKGSHATEQTYTYPSSSYSDVWCKRSTVELNGDTYTLSFWAKSSVAGDSIYVYFYNPNTVTSSISSQGNAYYSPDGMCIFTLSTVMMKYWVTYKMPKNSGSSKEIILPRLISGIGSGTVSVKWEKLEEGDKATDWTAAPEDLVSVSEMYYEYYLSTSDTELIGGSWVKELPDWTKGVYTWIRTTSLMTDGTYKYTKPKLYNVVQEQVEQMLEDAKSEITTKLEKGDKDISSTVNEIQTIMNQNIEAIKNLRSSVTQNSSSITAETKKLLEITNKITGLTTKEEISQWARYEDGVLTLGESNSPFSVKLSTTELGFYESGTRIAYISNQQLHISKAVILEKIQLGTFILEYDENVGFIIH